MNKAAPIVLFTYNRLWHTRQTVEALLKNELAAGSDLIVFSDGPKDENSRAKVDDVRKYLKTIKGFKSIKIIENSKNKGLAESIISGVTKVVNEYGKIIVLEDDLVTSPYFLRYMNDGLNLYENYEDVISVAGYSYPLNQKLPETFFVKGADCWGWGTWKRGWDLFEPDGQKLLDELVRQNITYEFDVLGSYPYTQMLKDQIMGKNNSWGVRWNASAFINQKLSCYPGVSMVQNIGFDKSGVHCGELDIYDVNLSQKPVSVNNLNPINDKHIVKLIAFFLKPNLFQKIINKIRKFQHRFVKEFHKKNKN